MTEVDPLLCVNLQILRASHTVLKVYDEAYRPFGVRATQLPVLNLIATHGPLTIKAIADETASERSVLSRKLQIMEASGWIREDVAAPGSREKAFVLTDKGRELVNELLPVRHEVQEKLLARLSAEERGLLLSLCGKLGGGE